MNQESLAQVHAFMEHISVTDGSESDAESTANGNDDIEPTRQRLNIGNVQINNCNDVTLGNRIIYQGPVTIHQRVVYRNRHDPEADSSGAGNQAVDALSRPGEHFCVMSNVLLTRKNYINSFFIDQNLAQQSNMNNLILFIAET